MSAATMAVLMEVAFERARQTKKHGDQSDLPDGTGPALPPPYARREIGTFTYRRDDLATQLIDRTRRASRDEGGDGSITFEHILTEEWAEVIETANPIDLRAELIQLAAVAVQWVEAIDGRAP